jgi:hypothetical protein
MPKGWKSPFTQGLYQVSVERTCDGQQIRVGPAMSHDAAAEFAQTIRDTIKSGQEKDWSNPMLHTVHLPRDR